jgi:hypothetical protein
MRAVSAEVADSRELNWTHILMMIVTIHVISCANFNVEYLQAADHLMTVYMQTILLNDDTSDPLQLQLLPQQRLLLL